MHTTEQMNTTERLHLVMKPVDRCTVVGWPASCIAHTFLRMQEILPGNRNARTAAKWSSPIGMGKCVYTILQVSALYRKRIRKTINFYLIVPLHGKGSTR